MQRRPSVSKGATRKQSRFARIPGPSVQRSVFQRSSGHKTAFDGGWLVPIFLDVAYPADTFSMRTAMYARFATLLHPVMDNAVIDIHFFAVPYRLVFEKTQAMFGEKINPSDTTEYEIPQISPPVGGYLENTIFDYMRFPINKDSYSHSALPLRAYNLVFNEWYRSQDLQNSLPVPMDEGPDDPADYKLMRRNKRHDYFSSCLPWPQKGDPVELPLGDTAPVTVNAESALYFPTGRTGGTNEPTFDVSSQSGVKLRGTGSSSAVTWDSTISSNDDASWNDPQLQVQLSGLLSTGTADLAAATSINVNQWREAVALQRMLEKDARGGTRYTELIRAHFGVVSPDARLQRPEFLGGTSVPVSINQVESTVGSGGFNTLLGELGGYGTALKLGGSWSKSFTEHTIIIGLASCRAELTYQEGLERIWSVKTKYDHYFPEMANLGEQAVLNKELHLVGDPLIDDAVFGYQNRWDELRYKPSGVSSYMRSESSLSTDTWHWGQKFENTPTLSEAFLQEDPAFERSIAYINPPTGQGPSPHLLADFWFDYRCVRPMPMWSTPGLARL